MNRKKRVLILNHNQEYFGTYWRCLNIGKALAKAGLSVTMICASGSRFDLLVRSREIAQGFRLITLPRVKYHRYFTGQLMRLLLTSVMMPFMRFDVCYAFTVAQPQIAIPAWIAKNVLGRRLIVDWDDLWGGGFAEAHGGIVQGVLSYCERKFVEYADRITYVSDKIGGIVASLKLGVPSDLIPNGADTERIPLVDKRRAREELGLDAGVSYIVSVGNTYTESLDILLESFIKVRSTIKDARLILVGENEIPDRAMHLFDQCRSSVILAGHQQFERIPLYLGAADCLALPMEMNPIEEARFPMRFGDYLCAGRPIVSNAVGEVRKYLEQYEAGLVSDPSDPAALAESISRTLADIPLSDRLSKSARALAEGPLNWGNIGERVASMVLDS